METIGNYAWDFDAKKWARRWTLADYTWMQWIHRIKGVR